ncbi:hypothetical protein [Microbacterium sp. MYb62]|uniref:hypothetical protein n=1 Tax=Microbacterium sp. MYb62 TaxID=1848690 RepID=UPI000CFD2804|nr:hypothetical protein [Microbacterium sp. MYb62]PRB12054.1 hypothetical protein CQ042_15770 [Microbacterium sp. MYb62]
MTEPQVWTLIGVFAAGMFGTMTLMSTMLLRSMQNGFEGMRAEFGSGIESARTDIRALHGRIDHLDRDVNAISRHLFGIDRG